MLNVLVVSIFVVTLARLIVLRITGEPESFAALRHKAESAIAEAGGYAVLASVTDLFLHMWRTKTDGGNYLSASDWVHVPATKKIQARLSPLGHEPWISDQSGYGHFPAHVVIRYGPHSSYVWLLIFASDNMPETLPDRTEHLGGAVYLSRKNL
jgi:hypothetical protein